MWRIIIGIAEVSFLQASRHSIMESVIPGSFCTEIIHCHRVARDWCQVEVASGAWHIHMCVASSLDPYLGYTSVFLSFQHKRYLPTPHMPEACLEIKQLYRLGAEAIA